MNALHTVAMIALAVGIASAFMWAMASLVILDARTRR